MRLPLLMSVMLLLGLTLPGHAQKGPAEMASPEMIKAALNAMECEWTVSDGSYAIDMKNRKFRLLRLDGGKRLLVKASSKQQPSLETINRYNEVTAVTTRAVRYEKFGTVLEAGLDCQLGVSEASLRKFLTRFVVDLGEFETFIARDKGGKELPKAVAAGEKQKPPLAIAPGSDDREFVITFPTSEPKNWETAWKVIWDIETGKQVEDQGFKPMDPKKRGFGGGGRSLLFKIKKAFFKPGQQAEWIQVLEDAHPQEFYVPYYFRGTRFFDLRDVGGYTTLSAKEGGAISQLMGKNKQVIAELRDTGPAFKHGNRTRRSEELTLFANFGASNYTYMVEYGFRDDGGIVFRHSPTGYNFFSHFDASHMHGSYWRIGMKLGPEGKSDVNQVYTVRLPTDPKAQGDGGKLDIKEVTKESFVDWKAQEFTRLRITNPNYFIVPDLNAPVGGPAEIPEPGAKPKPKIKPREPDRPSLPISYDLVTYPQGIARHERFKDEKFTAHDFWITRHDCPEKLYVYLGDYFYDGNGKLNPELRPLEKKNVVVWHSSSGLHTPRSEDGILKGNSSNNGQATIYWTTFELRPRNLFLTTPHYQSGGGAPPKIDTKAPAEVSPPERTAP